MRRTKIVATVGPACREPDQLEALIEAGVNVFRLNFAHGTHDELRPVIAAIRRIARDRKANIAMLGDLAGPKIRIGSLPAPVELVAGDTAILAPQEEAGAGELPTTYASLADDVEPGVRVLLDDGAMALEVVAVRGSKVDVRVEVGGTLRSNKGINLPGVRVSAPALTEKDRSDAAFAVEEGLAYLGLSFVRRPEDIRELRRILPHRGPAPRIIAKIEKDTALQSLDEILDLADGVMVARGDLGVELPFQAVPAAQKHIIHRAQELSKPVITATQMLESMIHSPRPTRAEASDVANAVYDGTDAVMLSGETAVGEYPVEAVRAMHDIITATERWFVEHQEPFPGRTPQRGHLEGGFETGTAVGSATVDLARSVDAAAIVTLTENGITARLVSSFRPRVPILAITRKESTYRALALVWGVVPLEVSGGTNNETMIAVGQRQVLELGFGALGQRILITAGLPAGISGATNTLRVEEL
jgi:pyruvate kinase